MELLPPSVLFEPTYHIVGFEMVALVVLVDPIVTTLPAVPVTVKEVKVFVVPPSNRMV